MNIYLLKQTEREELHTFSSCVVIAESEEAAKQIHPYIPDEWECENPWMIFDENGDDNYPHNTWASKPENVECVCIGVAAPGQVAGVVLSYYRGG